MAPTYTIVVPTRNGGGRLIDVMTGLDGQVNAPEFEIVVVDDGSTDDTVARLAERSGRRPIRTLSLPPRGPATARNCGVAAARGERIAFLGDDTIPAPDWLAEHQLAWSRRGSEAKVAVIGYTDWHPRLGSTPFLRFLNQEGLQFGFGLIRDVEDVAFNFFYTSNLSLDRKLLLAEPFDESFPYPAWEDIEAAYRLKRRGLRLVYEPKARVAHDHPTDLARFALRQERAGYCAVVFWQLHPELGPFLGVSAAGPPPLPSRWFQAAREGLVRALQPLPMSPRRLWTETLRYHYIRGLRRGWSERVGEQGGAS